MPDYLDDASQDTPLSPPQHEIPNTPSPVRHVFFGSDGLRAGWSILLFLAMFAAFMVAVHFIAMKIHPPTHHSSSDHSLPFGFMLVNEASPLLGVGLVSWLMSKVERRRAGVYGLGGASKLPHFVVGLAWGIICLTPLVLLLWKTGFLVIDSRLLFGSAILRYGVQWLILFFAVALLEEYLTRGYLLYTLTRGLAGLFRTVFKTSHSNVLAFWSSAVILSLLFGFAHGSNAGESPVGLLTAGLASMMFCLVLWRTGSLWWAIGFHTTWDWGQSFVYGVADSGIMIKNHLLATHPFGKPLLSGGTTGPEGSILILPILILIVAVIIFTLPRTNAGYIRLAEPRL